MLSGILRVLTSPDVVSLICRFQDGPTGDMLAFVSLPRRVRTPAHELAFLDETRHLQPAHDAVVTPWLARHGLSRLERLFIWSPCSKAIVVAHAAFHGRLDVLKHVHWIPTRSTDQPFDNATVLGALQGHVPVLEFLHSQGRLKYVAQASVAAASKGNLPVLDFIHQTVVTFNWNYAATLYVAAQHGQTTTLAWLLSVWVQDPVGTLFHALDVEFTCLRLAVRHGQHDTRRWLVKYMHGQGQGMLLPRVFAYEEHAVVDDIELKDVADAIWPVLQRVRRHYDMDNIARILDVLATGDDGGRRQVRAACFRILVRAVAFCRMDVLDWLVAQAIVDTTDLRDVLHLYAAVPCDRQHNRSTQAFLAHPRVQSWMGER
ncbi:Aste57867_25006 [Aphanomyces stellatus]|uniref:Aste57867_25006 protein n=1 Tax=Aphanomyces stellatus TaxID=120398 RepID=A0A485LW86_9STRA|nr:hypothetical protein As57867_024928 [Aphanomyces stellatus]VFU01637.1 Aste57867_25006 [Aphanomyces stellatus]